MLSQRAIHYLQKQERISSTTLREDIFEVFHRNNVEPYEPLIEFQQQYAGYIFYSDLVPIKFGLIHGEGGYPEPSGTSYLEFDFSESSLSKYHFSCVQTSQSYPINYTLGENGIFYEDYKPVATSFDKLIEHWALWGEIEMTGGYKVIIQNQHLKQIDLAKELNLELILEASDDYTLWFKGESIYMSQWQALTTITATETYKWKEGLLNLLMSAQPTT